MFNFCRYFNVLLPGDGFYVEGYVVGCYGTVMGHVAMVREDYDWNVFGNFRQFSLDVVESPDKKKNSSKLSLNYRKILTNS